MINKDKTYRTRDGREVRIYATDGSHPFVIHGAYRVGTNWISCLWLRDGFHEFISNVDLIEVKPRIKRTVWINVYDHGVTVYETPIPQRINLPRCRVKVEIDCEEGEGL